MKNGQKVVLLDHHPYKEGSILKEFDWASIIVKENDVPTCGSSLLYNHLINNRILNKSELLDDFVELVRCYDTWDWFNQGNKRSKYLNDVLSFKGNYKFISDMSIRLCDDNKKVFEFNEQENILLESEQKRIEAYIKTKNKQMVKVSNSFVDRDFTIGIVAAEQYHSELGNELCLLNEDIDFVVIVELGKQRLSFRTAKEDVNLSLIAQSYGGGGHTKSSGCSFNEESVDDFVLKLIK